MNNIFKQYKRGDIVWIKDGNFSASSKHTQKGERPAVILQNNVGNAYSPTLIVAYITGKIKRQEMPTHVIIDNPCLDKKSMILLEQIGTCDKEMIMCVKGHLTEEELNKMDAALSVSIGMKNKTKEIIKEVPKEIIKKVTKEVIKEKEIIKEKEVPMNFGPLKFEQVRLQGEIGSYAIDQAIHIHFKDKNSCISKTQIKDFIQELTHVYETVEATKMNNGMENGVPCL